MTFDTSGMTGNGSLHRRCAALRRRRTAQAPHCAGAALRWRRTALAPLCAGAALRRSPSAQAPLSAGAANAVSDDALVELLRRKPKTTVECKSTAAFRKYLSKVSNTMQNTENKYLNQKKSTEKNIQIKLCSYAWTNEGRRRVPRRVLAWEA